MIDPLVNDTSRYVSNSVANWLNDASRTNPEWVLRRCSSWAELHGHEVAYVCHRATRSIRKQVGKR